MKSSRFEIFLLAIPFICWIYCFRYFFTGHLQLEADSISYAQHIHSYTDNLSKGIFPLWDPLWFGGAPNDFFLRRIGDVNPLFFLIILLKWIGVSFDTAYLIFLAVYYFLAGWAFYLITRLLLAERFFAFIAYVLFLFSSWGSEVFYNYIVIIFVPIIWFFYFLLSFACTPRKKHFLGACFCAGLVVTTYIPFFFLTILAIFSILYVLFYGKECASFLKSCFSFFRQNKIFIGFCIAFLLVSCVPALKFYKESKSGEFVLPNRHSGADSSSAVAVSSENAANGDIISHGYFDRIFDDHANIDMGDIYIPYVFFIILLATLCAPVNKLVFFLLFNVLGLSLITITSAGGVQHFLYQHVIIFKFIRQLYYFFWLGMLPMIILLSVTAFKSLLSAIDGSSKKMPWLVYIIICHLVFAVFLIGHKGVLWGAWAAVFVSLLYFLAHFRYENKIPYRAGFCLILLAVFIQSAQVYGFLDKKLFKAHQEDAQNNLKYKKFRLTVDDLYYASNWFTILVSYLDPDVFADYRQHPYILYDNVIPYKDSKEFFKVLQKSMAGNVNVAFVPALESAHDDWKTDQASGGQADLDPVSSGELSVLHTDANTLMLKAHLSGRRFLVINDNYNSGWHAFINGRQAHLLRANVSFKGLWVPAGDSTIMVQFSNPKNYLFHFALIILFAGTFLYLLVLFKKEAKWRA